ASDEPTAALKRNTTWPKQGFIVVPLEPYSGKKIITALGGAVPKAVLHVQIEKGGALQFGAYDRFHPECIFFGSAVRSELVNLSCPRESFSFSLSVPPRECVVEGQPLLAASFRFRRFPGPTPALRHRIPPSDQSSRHHADTMVDLTDRFEPEPVEVLTA